MITVTWKTQLNEVVPRQKRRLAEKRWQLLAKLWTCLSNETRREAVEERKERRGSMWGDKKQCEWVSSDTDMSITHVTVTPHCAYCTHYTPVQYRCYAIRSCLSVFQFNIWIFTHSLCQLMFMLLERTYNPKCYLQILRNGCIYTVLRHTLCIYEFQYTVPLTWTPTRAGCRKRRCVSWRVKVCSQLLQG